MTGRFHIIQHRCRHCSRPITLRADRDCPQEWIDKLALIASCNPCFDRHEEERRAAERRQARAMAAAAAPRQPEPTRATPRHLAFA